MLNAIKRMYYTAMVAYYRWLERRERESADEKMYPNAIHIATPRDLAKAKYQLALRQLTPKPKQVLPAAEEGYW